MKIKILGFVFALGLAMVSVSLAQAVFRPMAKVRQIVVKIADFVPPPPVEFDSLTTYYLPKTTSFLWQAVDDYAQSHQPVSYEVLFDQAVYQSTQNSLDLDLSLVEEGQHELRIRACDAVQNCSGWSDQEIIVDGGEPIVTLSNRGYVLREAIGDDWLLVGEGDFSNEEWLIGPDGLTGQVAQSYLQFVLPNKPALPYLAFDFLWESQEDLLDFDQPGLVVLVNEKPIFIAERQMNVGWQKATLDLRQFSESELRVKIMNSNDDDILPTRLKIKNVTTNLAIIKNQDDLSLQISDEIDSSPSGGLLWTENRVSYFASDSAGNQTALILVPLFYDQVSPKLQIVDKQTFLDQASPTYLKLAIEDNFGLASWKIVPSTASGSLSILAAGQAYVNEAIFSSPFWLKVPPDLADGFEVLITDLSGNETRANLPW